jgi:ATP-dependent helicase/DNAse subunit B
MGVRPAYFELAFGSRNGGVDPASVEANLELKGTGAHDGDSILVQGRIDRVDRAEDGTLIAYDYKLSKGASRDDMSEGRDLQLAIYAAALENLLFPESEIAGGGYYVLRATQGRRNQGLYRKSLSAYTGIGSTVGANLSDDEWYEMRDRMMEKIWAFRDNMREGRFDVSPTAPSQTCGSCDYSKLCRFDMHRIRGKGGMGKRGNGEEGKIAGRD